MKKGEMAIGTIVAIALGIAVLVFLVFGFSSGWSNLWNKIVNVGGGSSNLDSIRLGCQTACAGNSVDAWCNQERVVKFGKEVSIGTETKTETTGTCKDFVKNPSNYPGLNIAPCAISCSP
jgi:hypothetical protein